MQHEPNKYEKKGFYKIQKLKAINAKATQVPIISNGVDITDLHKERSP